MPWVETIEFWLNRYQTLLSAAVAILAAWATIRTMRDQMRQSEKVARRIEDETEKALREIITTRIQIVAEVWQGIDWALTPDDEKEKHRRSDLISGLYWYTVEERIEFEHMKMLARGVAPRLKPKMRMFLLRWGAMLDFLDREEKERKLSPQEKIVELRKEFTLIARTVERYDVLLADVFAGCRAPFLNPGNTPERTRAVIKQYMGEAHAG